MTLALLRMLLVPLCAGAGIARGLGLRPRSEPIAYLAWAYALGALATALVTFAWLLTPLDKGSALVPELVVLALGAIGAAYALGGARVAPIPRAAPATWTRAPAPERALFALVVLALCVLTVQRALDGDLAPIFQDDEAHVWALKAKVLYRAGGFNSDLAAALSSPHYVYHRDYPLLVPCLEIFAFAHFGEVTHVVNRLPIQAFALALVPALAAALVRVVRPAAAAALCVLVLACDATRYQTRTAHADLALALGLLLALDAWLRWRAGGARGWFRLCAAGAALAVFAKNEALLFAAAAVIGLGAARVLRGRALPRPARAPRAWLLLPLAVCAATWTLNAAWGFTNDVGTTDLRDEAFLEIVRAEGPARLPRIAGFVARELLLERAWAGYLPIALVVLGVLLARRLRTDALGAAALAFAAAYAGVVLVFLGTPHDVDWHLPTAFPRVTWQTVPALALWVGAVAGRFLPGFAPRSPGPEET